MHDLIQGAILLAIVLAASFALLVVGMNKLLGRKNWHP